MRRLKSEIDWSINCMNAEKKLKPKYETEGEILEKYFRCATSTVIK